MQSGGRGSSPAPRVRRLADEMVGVQVAKEFDGRVYIGEVIASVPPEEDEEPATLAATRAPVAAGGAGIDGALRAAGVQPKGCGRLKRVEETEG